MFNFDIAFSRLAQNQKNSISRPRDYSTFTKAQV
jgi:hypothetical protein